MSLNFISLNPYVQVKTRTACIHYIINPILKNYDEAFLISRIIKVEVFILSVEGS